MIPEPVMIYLNSQNVDFCRRWHPRAVAGQHLAAALHISGHRVSKCVVVEVDGERMMAVLPVSARVDLPLLAQALEAEHVSPVPEGELAALFPQCELGAEPPLGRLFGLPVLVDAHYAEGEVIIFRAGTHEESIEMSFDDYEILEEPRRVPFARPMSAAHAPSEGLDAGPH